MFCVQLDKMRFCNVHGHHESLLLNWYSKTCVEQPLKYRQNKYLNGKCKLNEGQFVFFLQWSFYTGLNVLYFYRANDKNMAISYKQIFSVVVIASLTSVLAWGGDPWSREHYEETRRKHRSETLLPTENCYKYQWQCHEPKFGPRTMSCDNR